ncbi:DUF1707 domain-containing protein [Microlunatus sp. Gsoil 973]|jgi:hypothetical protein|uniref:DUF1707 SHOCT-like domain-containing protein n=1 Tax=Microlunatus sp. Gsoil 973 TaxID=2672569 RepID=UPI0012B477CB|nr:DUF1707 domain-containing protein [Microlunatus sp. Gsoil 973]QGN35080.1 DUF1707 domain-containing protein [Microlunatus sp. Gsoil 973]
MSELPISSKYRSTPDAPVTDDEREQLTRRLNDAFAAGKLDQDTYSADLDRLYAAQRLGELVPVVEKLPSVQTYNNPDMVQQSADVRPGEVSPARPANRLTIAVIAAIVLIVIIIAVLLVAIL